MVLDHRSTQKARPHCDRSIVIAVAMALAIAAAALAGPGRVVAKPNDLPLKFTTGVYHLQAGGGLESGFGLDLNLRYSRDDANFWIGWFRAPVLEVSQWRGGWDDRIELGPVTLVPSLQMASGGFLGGSAALETGRTWYGGAGLGRTNLRTYANLNFDPNDAWFVYGGYRWDATHSLQLQLIRDNRENPDQRHIHLLWRKELRSGDRLTVDLVYKEGSVEDDYIRRGGLSVGYDWPRWFVRAAWDPQVNFTPQNMVRLSFGSRF